MKGKAYNIISFIVGIGTLLYMVYKIGYITIWQNILQTGVWFIPVIVTWLLIYVLNALAFREIIYERTEPETRLPFLTVLKMIITGYAINNITPFLALGGEPYRIMQLRKRVGPAKAASSVLLYYIMHVYSHIVFWMIGVALILVFLQPGTVVTVTCLAVFAVFYLILLWINRQYNKGLLRISFLWLGKIGFLKNRVSTYTGKKHVELGEVDQHIRELFGQRKRTFYASLFFEFAGRVVGCLEIYFFALALNVKIGPVDSFIISAGSSLFANLIFFSPMQLGAREGGFVLALGSIGLAASAGLFISLATRIRELVWIFIGLIIIPVKSLRRR